MLNRRNKWILAALSAWILLFALGATAIFHQIVPPRLESIAQEALLPHPSLASLSPQFHGFSGYFAGAAASVDEIRTASRIVSAALPAGRLQPQDPTTPLRPHVDPSPPPTLVLPSPAPPQVAPANPETLASLTALPPAPPPTEPQISPAPPSSSDHEPAPSTKPPLPAQDAPPPSLAVANDSPEPPFPTPLPAPPRVDEWTGTVFFAPDSSVLHDSQLPILRRITGDSKSRPDYQLRIVSYADPRGDAEFNTWLSQRRASRVRAALASLGFDLEIEIAVELESPQSPSLHNPEIQRRVELRYIR